MAERVMTQAEIAHAIMAIHQFEQDGSDAIMKQVFPEFIEDIDKQPGAEYQAVYRRLIDQVAMAMLIGDPTLPPITEIGLLSAIQGTAAEFDVPAEDFVLSPHDASNLANTLLPFIVPRGHTLRGVYDETWRLVRAYHELRLASPDGTVSEDAFVRATMTAEEWLEQSNAMFARIQQSILDELPDLINLIETETMEQVSTPEEDDEFHMDALELALMFSTKTPAAFQAYRDRRYLEIWSISDD